VLRYSVCFIMDHTVLLVTEHEPFLQPLSSVYVSRVYGPWSRLMYTELYYSSAAEHHGPLSSTHFPSLVTLAALRAKKWGYHICFPLPCLLHFPTFASFLILSSYTDLSRESAKCCNSLVVPQMWQLLKSGGTVPPVQKWGYEYPVPPEITPMAEDKGWVESALCHNVQLTRPFGGKPSAVFQPTWPTQRFILFCQ